MSTYQCPKGHISTEPDYCSECGTKIQDSPSISVTIEQLDSKTSSTQNTIICPACSASHDSSSGNFCEICGYNFTTGVHGEIPPLKESTNPSPSTPNFLEITITIDPTLRSPESPEPPNQPPIILRLDKDSNLIGRCSEARGINPEVALNFDSAVSHRHALINRQSDGTFTLRDIASTNGTLLNKVELTPMVDADLQDGDELILGHWTRIKVILKNNT
ncbi:MAG: FHA domain-containing protein [Calothrix sp. C42_A2020_038]|nr:FHA domain-containing protein [Calothrix sp. C42_A2020_038]